MTVLSDIGRGAELATAVVFVVAGAAKLDDLDSTRIALGRVLFVKRRPARWIVGSIAAVLAAAEIAVGLLLVLTPAVVVDAIAAAFTIAFVVAVASAQRRGIACGCFGSLFTGTTGPAEMRRAVGLCVIASTGLVARWVTPTTDVNIWAALLATVCLLGLLVAVSRHPSSDAAETIRLTVSGRAPDRGGWRRATPWTRAAILREVQLSNTTAEVVAHPNVGQPSWRTSRVRIRRIHGATVASVIARAPGATVQALWRPGAPLAVVGYTRTGPVLPSSSRAT